MSDFPTAKLTIEYPPDIEPNSDQASSYVMAQISAKAAELVADGERPWFEIWYPGTTPKTFDAVQVNEDGSVETLPPYSAEGRAEYDEFRAATEGALA